MAKSAPGESKTDEEDEEMDHAIRQIVWKAVVSGEVIDSEPLTLWLAKRTAVRASGGSVQGFGRR
jgi:hypothetical protein